MTPADTIDFARSSIYVLLEVVTPAMLTALVVGLGIGLLQALTQIQEMTLVFVPKIIAIFDLHDAPHGLYDVKETLHCTYAGTGSITWC